MVVLFSMLRALGKHSRPTSARLIFRAHQLIQGLFYSVHPLLLQMAPVR